MCNHGVRAPFALRSRWGGGGGWGSREPGWWDAVHGGLVAVGAEDVRVKAALTENLSYALPMYHCTKKNFSRYDSGKLDYLFLLIYFVIFL